MGEVTLRVLDGADRGKVFQALPTPVTIGREEGNIVQLNDERISRFHIKIQEDQSKLVLTDLQSTNGTRVNGEEAQLRILRFGDVISLGRSVLLYGTREQIAGRLDSLRSAGGLDGLPHTLGTQEDHREAAARARGENARKRENQAGAVAGLSVGSRRTTVTYPAKPLE